MIRSGTRSIANMQYPISRTPERWKSNFESRTNKKNHNEHKLGRKKVMWRGLQIHHKSANKPKFFNHNQSQKTGITNSTSKHNANSQIHNKTNLFNA